MHFWSFLCAATALCFCDHPKPHQHDGDHNGNLRWWAAPTYLFSCFVPIFRKSSDHLPHCHSLSSLPLLSISLAPTSLFISPSWALDSNIQTNKYKICISYYIIIWTLCVYIYTYIFSLDITCMFLEYIGQVLRSRARTCERWHCN